MLDDDDGDDVVAEHNVAAVVVVVDADSRKQIIFRLLSSNLFPLWIL